ncbi:MAG: C2 family cysteine protease [Myxococcota bacterium]
MTSLGNSGGSRLPLPTQVGVRSLERREAGPTKKAAPKAGAERTRIVDGVSREDEDDKRRALQRLLSEDEAEEQAADQTLAQPSGHRTQLRRVDGLAFRRDPKGGLVAPLFSDVTQGNLGDAWLLASCAAVAQAAPQHILERVVREDDDRFSVHLGSITLVVSPEFPAERYADPTPNGLADTLWVALIEKAFAQLDGGSYQNLECGNPGRALEVLTGAPSTRVSLTERTPLEALWQRISVAATAARPMVLRTKDLEVSKPLCAEHTYAVLGASEQAGVRVVRVYNPWGTRGNTRPISSMIHDLPLDVVRADCEALYVSG